MHMYIYTYMYIYVFATFSFDTVFRVNASLFSVTSFKGVSSFAAIIALVLPVWEKPTQIAENLRRSKTTIAWMLLYTS